jgi:hypothetical protein
MNRLCLYIVGNINDIKREKGSAKRRVNLHSIVLSDITNAGSPERPSGDMGVNFATM